VDISNFKFNTSPDNVPGSPPKEIQKVIDNIYVKPSILSSHPKCLEARSDFSSLITAP